MKKSRGDSRNLEKLTTKQIKLHSEGAEFLVLGNLLIRGIDATKAYTNYPGWDVMAFTPHSGKSARIQVKSRFATDALGFLMGNLDFDFLVMAKLNRGKRYTNPDENEIQPPEFFVVPIADVKKSIKNPKTISSLGGWRLTLNHLPKPPEAYRENWRQISDYLVE